MQHKEFLSTKNLFKVSSTFFKLWYFFFNDTATTEIYTLSLHDALPISVDYGQPHARGRAIVGSALVPFDQVWRTGANEATSLSTDVDLTIGGVAVPKGSYTLYTLPSRTGPWKLIINKNTGQWGTEYRAEHDLARVDLRSRQLREPLDSFSIWLVPEVTRNAQGGIGGGLPRGVLRMAWGEIELSTDWSVR